MANSEPRWPSPDEANAAYRINEKGIAETAIVMCREAFLDWQRIENDDPASDAIGTIRESPDSGLVVYLSNHHRNRCWRPIIQVDDSMWINEEVKGWPIVGVVPFTPAAEAKP